MSFEVGSVQLYGCKITPNRLIDGTEFQLAMPVAFSICRVGMGFEEYTINAYSRRRSR